MAVPMGRSHFGARHPERCINNFLNMGVFNRLFPGKWTNKLTAGQSDDILKFLEVDHGPFFTKLNLEDNLRYQVFSANATGTEIHVSDVKNVSMLAFMFKSEYFNEERIRLKLHGGVWYSNNL